MSIVKVKLSFANHVRTRSSALINLVPYPHHYQNVLRSIAYLDWQQEQNANTADYEFYLAAAGISSNETAIAYLDWLEAKLRRWLSRYEQMLAVHKQELELLVLDLEREPR